MKKFLANWELKILAVMSAMIFWFLVVGTENTFYTFPEKIPVKAFNLANDLVVSDDLSTVSLRLKIGNRESIKNLTANDFSAFVDLEGQKEGEVTVRVEVSSKSSDIAVVKVEPAEIKVKIEKTSEKEVPIDHKIEGDTAEGFQVENVEISKEKVLIKGSQDVLDGISKVTALISLNNNREDLSATVPLFAYDGEGNVIQDVKFNEGEEEVGVTVLISQFKNQKILGVKPSVVGTPDDSVWIKSINVNPSYIVAKGDQQILEDLEFASTQDINVDGLKENKTFTVLVADLPEGIEVENGSINVSIEVQSYESVGSTTQRKTVNVPLIVKKFKSVQRGSTIDPPSLTLVAEGAQEDLDKISDSLKIELDISGISQSGGTLDTSSYNVDLPNGVSIVSLNPQFVTVTWDQ